MLRHLKQHYSTNMHTSSSSTSQSHSSTPQELAVRYEALQPEVAEAVTAAEVFAVPPAEGEKDRDGATSTGSSALSDSLPGEKEKKPKTKKGKKGPPSSPSAGRKRRSLDNGKSAKGAEQKDGASSPKGGSKKQRSPVLSPSHQIVPTSPSAAFDNGSGSESAFVAMAPSLPSGPYLHHQLQKLKGLNDETKSLLDDWQTRAVSGLEEALKFEEDYDSMYQWVEGKKGEADELGPVGVTEEKIMEQIAAVEVRGGEGKWLVGR